MPGASLSAWSRSAASRQAVQDIAETHAAPEAAVREADCIVLAGPVDALPGLLASALRAAPPTAWVTDVGSTKRGVHAAAAALGPEGRRFVGGHPMAGSERGGAGEARDDLLLGRPCIVTTDAHTAPGLDGRAAALWSALGGRPIHLSPEEHDRAVAVISHLPHAAACALAHLLGSAETRLDLAAGGLRDTTRVAAGDTALWIPILLENADHLAPLLAGLEQSAAELRRALEQRDAGRVGAFLSKARDFRRRLDQP